jgi:hypothetical protein
VHAESLNKQAVAASPLWDAQSGPQMESIAEEEKQSMFAHICTGVPSTQKHFTRLGRHGPPHVSVLPQPSEMVPQPVFSIMQVVGMHALLQ